MTSPNVCISTGSFYAPGDGSTRDYVRSALQLPVDGIEITFAHPRQVMGFSLGDEELLQLRRLPLNSIHAPWEWDEGGRIFYGEEDTPFMQKVNEIAKSINAKHIVLHIFKAVRLPFISGNPFITCIENFMDHENLPSSLYRRILNKNPGLGFCLDTTHALTISYQELLFLAKTYKKDITYIHLSGNDMQTGIRHKPFSKLTPEERKQLGPIRNLPVPFVIETWAPQGNLIAFYRKEIDLVRAWRA